MNMIPLSRFMEMCQPSLNEGIREQPEPVSRCCYSNCNRLELFVLASFKLVLSLKLFFRLLINMILCIIFGRPLPLYHILFLSIASFIDVVDIIIGFATIINICVNDKEKINMYYMYSIYIFGPINILCCLVFYKFMEDNGTLIILLSLFILLLMIQMCLNYMMKNELLMLRNNEPTPL